eukprot:1159989-Pelagomonas_calceolata.AAC.7
MSASMCVILQTHEALSGLDKDKEAAAELQDALAHNTCICLSMRACVDMHGASSVLGKAKEAATELRDVSIAS